MVLFLAIDVPIYGIAKSIYDKGYRGKDFVIIFNLFY
jgi:hypothetical protein